MTYKTLLTFVTDAELAESQVARCVELARAMDAHLDVMCLGVDVTQTGYSYAGVNMLIVQETWSKAHEAAEALGDTVSRLLSGADIRWSCETSAVALMDVGRHVARHALFADLVVLPRPYGDDAGIEREAIVEAALFQGRAPVLVLPDGAAAPVQPRRVVVGWNESPEALTAVRRALPFLQKASQTHITIIDPPEHGPDRSDPGGLLSQMLSRHGVSCEIDVLAKTLPRVSEIINRHTTDVNADMVVMGAYGHSRLREAILGGATRNMLEQATVPVLLAH